MHRVLPVPKIQSLLFRRHQIRSHRRQHTPTHPFFPLLHFPSPRWHPLHLPSFLLSTSLLSTTVALHHSPRNHPSPPNSESTAGQSHCISHVPGVSKKNRFWSAVSLIVGTAVGPGMLGLPSAAIRSGTVPSTVAILLSWIYVISSILLVVEMTFAAMEDGRMPEASFTSLAAKTLGNVLGTLVALVYATLSISLLTACVAGIGSIAVQQWPAMHPFLAHAIFPSFAGALILLFPFDSVDAANRILCVMMVLSLSALVAVAMSIGRIPFLQSLNHMCWTPAAVMPAIPVTVLTLGFHVITPFMCKVVGGTASDARKAVLLGGAVPLLMVLSWNVAIQGLAWGKGGGEDFAGDPILLLLSVTPAALPAVRCFAFAALGTSLIGYAVSLPRQLADTLQLMSGKVVDSEHAHPLAFTLLVLVVPVIVATFFSSVFAKALNFAGVYANCFLFGILPPAMAWIHRRQRKKRSELAAAAAAASSEQMLPGGSASLLLLFSVAVVLGIWNR